MASASARTNDYFVPRDGIDREVIQSDICRYLGRDALVRPGTFEGQDGRVVQGYFITAYRNLTSAMIQDLKTDSIRWENEKRAASRAAGGGTGGARQPTSYSDWKSHQESSTNADFEPLTADAFASPAGAMDLDPYGSPQSFVGPGAANAYTTQPLYKTAPQPYGNPSYSSFGGPGVPPAFSTAPGNAGSYVSAGTALGSSYTEPSYEPGANYQVAGAPGYPAATQQGRLPVTLSAASRTPYPSSGAPGFSDDDYYNTQTATQFPTDPLYGRGSNPGRSGYNAIQDPYDSMSSMSPSVGSAGTTPAPVTGQLPRRETEPSHRRERSDRDDRHRRHR